MAYTTLEKVKADLGITGNLQDTILTDYINYASSLIDSYIGRSLEAKDYIEIYKIHKSEYPDLIVLKNTPVNSIVSVKLDGVLLSNNDYEVNLSQGIILLKKWSLGSDVEVAYNAGYTEIPVEIEFITRRIAVALYQKRDGLTITSEKAGSVSVSYSDAGVENNINNLLNSFSNVLDRFKHVAV